MKRTLALLIAVLMVVAMLPLSTLAAAGQANVGAPAPENNQANDQSSESSQTPPAPTSDDYFAVYDEKDAWVGYFATLAEADAALEDGYTLKVLQNYTADASYTWGAARADKKAPIAYTVDGALAEGGNAVITAGEAVEVVWIFNANSTGDKITLKNITVNAEQGAVAATADASLTLENCKLYAGKDGVALDVTGVALRIVGEDTVLRAENGAALVAADSTVSIENGYFYSSAAAKTVALTDATLSVTDATIVNDVQYALFAENSNAYIHGGQYVVTAAAKGVTDAAAICAVKGSTVLLWNGLAVAGAGAYAVASDEQSTAAIYGVNRAATTEEYLSNANVRIPESYVDTTVTEGALEITVVGEGTVEEPAHKIAVTVQGQTAIRALDENAATALRIYNAEGELVIYELAQATSSAYLGESFWLYVAVVPNGGKLVLDTNITVTETLQLAPKMAITIEGGKEGIEISGAVADYLMNVSNEMDVTFKNITLKNTIGAGLYAKGGVVTLAENAAVVASAEALCVSTGATVKLEDNALVQSTALSADEAVVVVEGGATFEMNGADAAVKAPAVQGATAFLSREVAQTFGLGENTYTYTFSQATIRLNDGDVVLPAKAVSLHQLGDENVVPAFAITASVNLRSAQDADAENAFLFNNKEDAVELLDKDTHIAYYNSIAAALADVKDGYTIRLLADHVETGVICTAFEEIDWTLDGDGHRLYMPEFNTYGMEFAGKNTKLEIKNLTLFAGGNGITVNPATIKDGVGVIANNVFVYAAGADDTDLNAYMGDPADVTAFRVTNRGGELIILGDKSGAYVNAQYAEGSSLIHNRGYLAVYGGTYNAPVSRLVYNQGAGGGVDALLQVTTYVAGGLFVVDDNDADFISNSATGVTIVTGGTIVVKDGNAFQVSSGTVSVYGGDFYHLSDDVFTPNTSYVSYYGGNFYLSDAAAETFLSGAKLMATRQFTDAAAYVTADAEVALGIATGTALTKISAVVNEVWLSENELTHEKIAIKVYTGNGDNFIPVYNETDLKTALHIVGPYNGKVELQKDVDKMHTAITQARGMGPIASITLTSAPGECFTYASSNYTKDGKANPTGTVYFLWLNGGNWRIENLTLANYGSQLLQINSRGLSRITVTVGEGGELSGHSSVVFMNDSNTHLIVEEGAFLNVSANGNKASSASSYYGRLHSSSNIVRLVGGSDLTVYGSLGYDRKGNLPDNGGYRCINYHDGADQIAGTGEQCNIYLGETAKLGTPAGTKTNPVINVNISDFSVAHDVFLTAEGTTFETDGYVLLATSGMQVVMDGVTIRNTDPKATAFKGGESAFVMNGAGGVFKNIKYLGSAFMSIDSKGMPKQDALTITFEGENEIIGTSSALLWSVAASCNTDLVINDGYYQSEVGNYFRSTADEVDGAASEGKLTINGGTFYENNASGSSMFLLYGSYDAVINGGFFDFLSNAYVFNMSSTADKAVCSAELTINGGEFEIGYGWLYSDDSTTNENKLTINDCHVIAKSSTDVNGTARSATGIMRIGGKCEATINGGVFETEEFATNKTCDIIQSRHTARVTINDWTAYHRSGNESAIRVMGDSNITVNGGWIESNGRFVVRTMAGSNTSTALKTQSKAVLTVYGGTMILNPSHPKLSTSSSNCVIGNGGSEQFGHVYIWGGQFINRNDADRLTPDSNYSRQVLGKINAFGDFEIHGGIIIATAVQDYFFVTESNANANSVSIPTVDLPIVKGVTPKYEMDGRDYYYVVYGMGDSLLVPELQTSFEVEITEKGNGLKFVAAMGAIHYDALITWARAHAYAYNKQFDADTTVADNYTLKYGMVITTVEGLRKTNGSISKAALEAVEALYLDIPADAADAVMNADGTLDITAIVENVPVEDNTVQFMAIPYVEIMLGVGTAQVMTERHFGEYNTNAGVASMATVAAAILRDNTDIATGAYQYPSITVKNAFNRYTVEQQEILLTYLAHEHSFDHKGVCQDAACGADVAVAVQENVAQQLYTEGGVVKFYKLTFKAGVSYTIGFTKDVVTYTLYNESGAVCALSAGRYTATEDGTYYLRVQGKKVGSTQLIVSHIHDANHLGECEICEQTVSVELTVEQTREELFVKQNLYFYNVKLEANVDYAIELINGTFTLYDAMGNEQELMGSVFACAETGTYYICVEATYTAKASIAVKHVHSYNHMGVCVVMGCGHDVSIAISGVYKYSPAQKVMVEDMLYFAINMMAGRTYTVRVNHYIGGFALYDEMGNLESDFTDGDSFTCEADGMYYLIVKAEVNVNNAQLRFEASHGEDCTYNNKGECEFEHVTFKGEMEKVTCGKVNRTRLYDAEKQNVYMQAGEKYYYYFNYAGAGITYVIDLPTENVSYILCDEDGKQIAEGVNYEELLTYTPAVSATDSKRTATTYVDEDTDRILYLVVTYTGTEEQTVTLSISHVHSINHTGVCAVKDTTKLADCTVNYRKTLEIERTTTVEFAANSTYYYEVRFQAGMEYKMTFVNCPGITWVVKDENGNLIHDSKDGNGLTPSAGGYYYLIVTAAQNSTGTAETPATVTIQSHAHTLNNKGACSCGYENTKFIIDLDKLAQDGGLRVGQLTVGKYYMRATMEAGKTYTLKFDLSVGKATVKLYGGENADVEKTLNNGAFTCTEAGAYCYVVEISSTTAASDKFSYTVDGSVAHVHTFTSAYHYVEKDGKYYLVVDKCDEASCNASYSEEITALTIDTATEIEYVVRGQYKYAVALTAGNTYTVNFTNATATWKLVKADGTEVASNDTVTFACDADGVYYLEVVATSTSTNKDGAVSDITVAAQ